MWLSPTTVSSRSPPCFVLPTPKTLMLEKLKAGGEGATEVEVVGWHHSLNGREFEQALGDSEGLGILAGCSPWGRRVGHD